MAGGGDQKVQKERMDQDGSSDSDDESSDEGGMEGMMEDFERRLDREHYKRQLQLEIIRRKAGHQSFVREFNKMWDDIMKPIPVSDTSSSEDESETTSHETDPKKRESSGEGATNVRSRKQPSTSNNTISICSSDEDDVAQKEKTKKRKRQKTKCSNSDKTNVSSDKSQSNIQDSKSHVAEGPISSKDGETKPRLASEMAGASVPANKYRQSPALLMFKWARNKPEFQDEKERVNSQVYQTEEMIERQAFFQFFKEKNKEEKKKLDQEKEERAKEWDMEKRRKRDELKSKADYDAWAKKEKPRRIKQDQKKRRRHVRELRKFYLGGQEDIKFEKGSEPPLDETLPSIANNPADINADA